MKKEAATATARMYPSTRRKLHLLKLKKRHATLDETLRYLLAVEGGQWPALGLRRKADVSRRRGFRSK